MNARTLLQQASREAARAQPAQGSNTPGLGPAYGMAFRALRHAEDAGDVATAVECAELMRTLRARMDAQQRFDYGRAA